MTDNPLDRDLEEMIGTPQLADAVKRSLQRLKGGAAGPELAEMARELLSGGTDLRSVARTSAYADPISQGIQQYKRWEADLSPDERQRLMGDAQAAIYGDDEQTTESRTTGL
ncbi:hypothetical protein GCM10023322_38330 [Rugosimonospora acidiphila]|uniref:Uncharacterized protein n=1 Tax=Rugosimonospora acidiphila TaxID=556531 RepID=A0ABP9RVW0_9ACTN